MAYSVFEKNHPAFDVFVECFLLFIRLGVNYLPHFDQTTVFFSFFVR